MPIEIKCSLAPSADRVRSLAPLMDVMDIGQGFVIGLGDDNYPVTKQIQCIGIRQWVAGGLEPFWED